MTTRIRPKKPPSAYRRPIPVTWDARPADTTLAPLAHHLLDTWAGTIQADKPTALGTPLRNSDAGRCSKAIAYKLNGTPESDPTDLAGFWRMSTGTQYHELWQQMLAARDDVQVEVPVKTVGCDGSGHIDAVRYQDGHAVECYELKTVGRYKFELSIGWTNNRPADPKGPEWAHIAQGALNAAALQAAQPDGPDVVLNIVFFSMESLSPSSGDRMFGKGHEPWRRFMATWTFVRDEWEPIAQAEAARMQQILDASRGGLKVRPFVPDEPDFQPHRNWRCNYCGFKRTCARELAS